jgi:hypothetical protein
MLGDLALIPLAGWTGRDMKHLTFTLILAASLPLAAYAGPPTAISKAKPEELKQYSNEQLCTSYFKARQPANVKAEIESRGFIKADQWAAINEHKIGIGMPEAAVYCAWGPPDTGSRYISAYGERKTMIYRRGDMHRQYVYIVNGKIDSMSNH